MHDARMWHIIASQEQGITWWLGDVLQPAECAVSLVLQVIAGFQPNMFSPVQQVELLQVGPAGRHLVYCQAVQQQEVAGSTAAGFLLAELPVASVLTPCSVLSDAPFKSW